MFRNIVSKLMSSRWWPRSTFVAPIFLCKRVQSTATQTWTKATSSYLRHFLYHRVRIFYLRCSKECSEFQSTQERICSGENPGCFWSRLVIFPRLPSPDVVGAASSRKRSSKMKHRKWRIFYRHYRHYYIIFFDRVAVWITAFQHFFLEVSPKLAEFAYLFYFRFGSFQVTSSHRRITDCRLLVGLF